MFKILTITGSAVAGVILSLAIAQTIPEGKVKATAGLATLFLPPALTTSYFIAKRKQPNIKPKIVKRIFKDPRIKGLTKTLNIKLLNNEEIEYLLMNAHVSGRAEALLPLSPLRTGLASLSSHPAQAVSLFLVVCFMVAVLV